MADPIEEPDQEIQGEESSSKRDQLKDSLGAIMKADPLEGDPTVKQTNIII